MSSASSDGEAVALEVVREAIGNEIIEFDGSGVDIAISVAVYF